MPTPASSTNPSVSDLIVNYTTPSGKQIRLCVPELPNDPEARRFYLDEDKRPDWVQAHLDSIYREYRQADNRRRTDVSIDHGDAGADFFAAPGIPMEEQVLSNLVVLDLLSDLTPQQAAFIELHAIDRDQYTQIAEDMTGKGQRISADAVRKTFSRGMAQLKKKILADPSGYDLPHALQVQGSTKRTTDTTLTGGHDE